MKKKMYFLKKDNIFFEKNKKKPTTLKLRFYHKYNKVNKQEFYLSI